MRVVQLIQGTPAWHAHRAQHWNASDAPAMLGLSPYKTRAQLLRECATGVSEEVDDATQKRFDAGHRFEALARPLAEAILGAELYPCVGVEGKYSASFDGLTLMEDLAFEHKSLNDDLRAALVDGCTGADLPLHYQVQMEQQSQVAGGARVLFMASKWNGDELVEERHCWYEPNPELAARIHAGWQQFEADLQAYQTAAPAPAAATGHAPDQLPALRIEVTGMVTASNLAEWKEAAIAVFQGINSDLQTDQDFADAERTVRWCGDIEDQLKAAKQHALSQTASIDELFRTVDAISEEARQTRLKLDKLVKARKETIRTEIVERGRRAVLAHYEAINVNLGAHALQLPAGLLAELGAAIKGRKTVASLNDAVDSAVANFKIAASQRAESVRANIHILEMEVGTFAALFPDSVQLCASKAPEDLRNLITARVSDHKAAEAKRLEAERERIRQEEVARIEREQAASALKSAEDAKPAAEPAPVAETSFPPLEAVPTPARSIPTSVPAARIKLGQINERIAPLTISAEGLATLGFKPVGTERAAKLYSEAEFPNIVRAMGRVLRDALDLDKAA